MLFKFDNLRGGKKKKKKKKIPNTPKKNKHIKKKNPLNILKILKISKESVKINKFCTNNSCSLSSFMAKHENRFHCGRCGKTKIRRFIKNKA
ncbi:40S ribosomal protein S27A (nucleomorph) [Lotharella oceanica]|uniref:40S ribosomal protein S27A n=1 Tax=Lotharella oceanica TaxID=641309 RepID=A0A060DAN2_9EUKA|nr:40S ribosomal protein S27A [Lotharella oceanica]|mmetsp:Transcript_4383/g.8781  ORF Transcript_4383/g.8781 Transcript_4383/m.8781 type:complete len:92 (+) Transcript_4383:21-296(+)